MFLKIFSAFTNLFFGGLSGRPVKNTIMQWNTIWNCYVLLLNLSLSDFPSNIWEYLLLILPGTNVATPKKGITDYWSLNTFMTKDIDIVLENLKNINPSTQIDN